MLPKRKSRCIEVGGTRFQYSISCSWKDIGWWNFNVTIQSEPHNGSKLLVKGLVTRDFWLDFPDPIEPDKYPIVTSRHIKNFIVQAIEEGWKFEDRGRNYVLAVTNESVFAAV